mgnify:CR=1 FL=1|tara:strand:- start:689 stop:1417 length:729 start_codon:yes stop_codon:yes gene_type:complete
MEKLKILAIIPARLGSKNIPMKNIQTINKKPIIAYAIKSALDSNKINKIVVSTDSSKIASISKKYGVETPFLRPKKYSGSKSSTNSVVSHTLNYLSKNQQYIPDIITILQPTTPFRTSVDIDKSIKLLEKTHATSVLGVTKMKRHPYKSFWLDNKFLKPFKSDFKKFFQRQLLPPLYSPTGSIYTFWYQTFKKYGNYYGPKIKPLILDNEIDIDDWEDLFFSEMKLKYWNNFKLNRIDRYEK